MINKKLGFTLIELLAVIVILAIIALIAVPQILGVIEKSRKGAAEVSALGYIDAVEKYMIMHDIDSSKYPYDLKNNTWNVADSTATAFLDLFVEKVNAESTVPALNTFIDVKGTKPTSGTVTVNDKKVVSANLVMNGYSVECENEECSVGGKSEVLIPATVTPEPTPDLTPSITLGSVTSTTNSITIPFTVENTESVTCIYGTDTNYGSTGTVDLENMTCTINGLNAETKYYYRLTPISSTNSAGESKEGNIETLTNKVYLYEDGNEYSSITGGWNVATQNYSGARHGGAKFVTNNMISLENYNKLYITISKGGNDSSSAYNYSGVCIHSNSDIFESSTQCTSFPIENVQNSTYSIDLTNYNSSYYVSVGPSNWLNYSASTLDSHKEATFLYTRLVYASWDTSISTYKIWLE